MSHAEKCPVCGGDGEVEQTGSYTGDTGKRVCHGCNGQGWIIVQD